MPEPEEHGGLLAESGLQGKAEPDSYAPGGVVQRLENAVAEQLGKEMAVWLQTGTLAIHLAVRLLADSKRRVSFRSRATSTTIVVTALRP